MKFWDASAIVPLLMTEPTTKTVQTLAEKDPTLIVWWGRRSNARQRLRASNATMRLTMRRRRRHSTD